MTMTSRKFGVEIEAYNVSYETLRAGLAQAGLQTSISTRGHVLPNTWKVTTDGSVSGENSFELVSPILEGEDGLEQLRKASAVLVRLGAKVNKSCGLHVHVDARDLRGVDLVAIVKSYAQFETAIDAFMPVSRRASNNSYCDSCIGLARRLETVSSGASARDVAGRVTGRYWKVNLQAFIAHGTVEFRQHSGTVEARKIIPWVLFCLNFVESNRVRMVRQEVQTTRASDGGVGEVLLRKNAIVKRFAKLAEALEGTDRFSYVSPQRLAAAMEVAEESVASYISQFRSRYNVTIVARRGRGYFHSPRYNGGVRESLCALVGTTPVEQATVRVIPPSFTDPFQGLPGEVVSYFQERTMELAQA